MRQQCTLFLGGDSRLTECCQIVKLTAVGGSEPATFKLRCQDVESSITAHRLSTTAIGCEHKLLSTICKELFLNSSVCFVLRDFLLLLFLSMKRKNAALLVILDMGYPKLSLPVSARFIAPAMFSIDLRKTSCSLPRQHNNRCFISPVLRQSYTVACVDVTRCVDDLSILNRRTTPAHKCSYEKLVPTNRYSLIIIMYNSENVATVQYSLTAART